MLPKPLPFPQNWSLRLPKKREPVTLITGFRCASEVSPAESVFVVCADSQETVEIDGESYRVTRQKIKPETCGNFEIAIGGSSVQAKLVDATVRYIHKKVAKFSGTSVAELEELISESLLEFGRKDARLYSKKERVAEFMILARSLVDSSIECWQTSAAQLVPLEKKGLIGFREYLYEHVLDRFYPESAPLLPSQQAVLLGIYLLRLAEDTSNCVRAPFTVVIGRRETVTELPLHRVQNFQERINLFCSQADHILLSLADHTIWRPQYEAKLDEFKATVLRLRDDYVQDAAPKTVEELINTNDPIPNLPPGITMPVKADGTCGIVKEMTVEERQKLREKIEWVKAEAEKLKAAQEKIKPSASERSEQEP
jgi:hypothetical protein